MNLRVLNFIYFGGSILHFVKCFSNGNFDFDQDICQTMEVHHGAYNTPQDSTPPFIVDPVNITVIGSDLGKAIEGESLFLTFTAI